MNDEPLLNAPLDEHLRPSLSPGEDARLWRSFKLRQQSVLAKRSTRRRKIAAGVAIAVAAAAVVAMALWPHGIPTDPSGPLALAGGQPMPTTLDSSEGPSVFDLDDGSRIVLAPSTDARVVANDENELRTTLVGGSATFDVRPGGPRRWVIDAGRARVEVLGTRFTVRRDEEAVEVQVERGVVEVHHRAAAEPARLEAGESIRLETDDGPDAEPSTTEPAPDPAADPEPVSTDAPEPVPTRDPEPVSTRDPEPTPTPTPESLLHDADTARYAGNPTAAARLYAQLVRLHPNNVRAPVAAFSLGRLELDHDQAAAADSFAFVRRHREGAALREEATALEVEAAAAAGQHERARRIASAYLERYPNGRHAPAMRHWTEAP